MANRDIKMADMARLKYNIKREKGLILENVNANRWRHLSEEYKVELTQEMADMVGKIAQYGSINEPDYIMDNWAKIVDLNKYGIFI